MRANLKKFTQLIEALESLPSIGKKSATRLAFYMVLDKSFDALRLAHAIEEAVTSIGRCAQCGGLSEDELCAICSDPLRQESICIVSHPKDIFVIEDVGEYKGRYFVMDRLDEEHIERLKAMAKDAEEIIFAFSPSVANEAMTLYIEDALKDYPLKFSRIAHGVPTGVSLENVDTLSLAKALRERVKIG